MQARSIQRKEAILIAAQELLIQQGYEATTFKKVAKRARSVVGSVINFYGTKASLMAAVADQILGAIATEVDGILQTHDADVERAVPAIVAAAITWRKKFPEYRRLLACLDASARCKDSEAQGLQSRLEPILDVWSERLFKLGRIRSLSAAQLYAVLVAPALC